MNEQDNAQREVMLRARNLTKQFAVKSGFGKKKAYLTAVNNVSFDIYRHETLGLVGESGCGKSTTGRLLLQLLQPTSGSVEFEGSDLERLNREEMRRRRQYMQFIFQDPYASLDPRYRIQNAISEPLVIFNRLKTKAEKIEKVKSWLQTVGLDSDAADKYPHEFSGGQRQRICIARALALNPKFIVADEPVSALDVSIQAQVINLLLDLKEEYGLSYLFISHDLGVVKYICDRVAVMYLGHIVELAEKEELFSAPRHPYTQALLKAVPQIGRKKQEQDILTGEVPSPINPPSGCVFHPRCKYVTDKCHSDMPPLTAYDNGHSVACWRGDKL